MKEQIPKYFLKSWFAKIEEATAWRYFFLELEFNEKTQYQTWAEGAD